MYVFHEGFDIRFWDIEFSEFAYGVFLNGSLFLDVVAYFPCFVL